MLICVQFPESKRKRPTPATSRRGGRILPVHQVKRAFSDGGVEPPGSHAAVNGKWSCDDLSQPWHFKFVLTFDTRNHLSGNLGKGWHLHLKMNNLPLIAIRAGNRQLGMPLFVRHHTCNYTTSWMGLPSEQAESDRGQNKQNAKDDLETGEHEGSIR